MRPVVQKARNHSKVIVACDFLVVITACGSPKMASGAKTQVSISIASGSRVPRRPDSGHVTLCYLTGQSFLIFQCERGASVDRRLPADAHQGAGAYAGFSHRPTGCVGTSPGGGV